jgi:hypothetical protein
MRVKRARETGEQRHLENGGNRIRARNTLVKTLHANRIDT